ncbi:MAG: hypothetical protein ACHP78_10965 [Terriglobales bacterium]
MMTTEHKAVGDIKYYRDISILILIAIAAAGAALLCLNSSVGSQTMLRYLGPQAAFGLQLFFWGALGAAIASSLFLANDKEENEIESIKEKPDLSVLRYPTRLDVHLYGHRILTSACLAVIGGLFLYAGLSYFDVPADLPNAKHRAFFILFSFLIGLYQGTFVTFLSKRFEKMLEKRAARAAKR